MKKKLVTFIVIAFLACNSNKSSPDDPVLKQRLNEFIKFYKELDIENVVNYVYPKLFTTISRDQAIENMKRCVSGSELNKRGIDSATIDKVYPIFKMDNASYAKIDFTIAVSLNSNVSKDSLVKEDRIQNHTGTRHIINESYPAPQITLMYTLPKGELGEENLSLVRAAGIFKAQYKNTLVAVKDEFAKEWSFFTVTGDQELINKLFSRKVLDKLASHN